jgi:hypothetical protein
MNGRRPYKQYNLIGPNHQEESLKGKDPQNSRGRIWMDLSDQEAKAIHAFRFTIKDTHSLSLKYSMNMKFQQNIFHVNKNQNKLNQLAMSISMTKNSRTPAQCKWTLQKTEIKFSTEDNQIIKSQLCHH